MTRHCTELGAPSPEHKGQGTGRREEVKGESSAKWGAEEPCPYFSVTGQLHPALEENSKGQLLVASAAFSRGSSPPHTPAMRALALYSPLALPSSPLVLLVQHQFTAAKAQPHARAGEAVMSVPGLF